LIDPDNKVVLAIDNQDSAREHIGDFVEVTGNLDSSAKMLHVASLKLLQTGAAACARPKSAH